VLTYTYKATVVLGLLQERVPMWFFHLVPHQQHIFVNEKANILSSYFLKSKFFN